MIVPNLKKMKKEEAEQTALAHGLHYQYFLEYANYPEGHVYKQNLNAGETFQEGDTISFWVSKGPAPESP
nr:PASTA domain-containing protein [Ammoniphilus resinae]